MVLRPPRQTTLEVLIQMLNSFRDLVGPVAALQARTIAIRYGDRWYNFASSAALTCGPPAGDAAILLRNDVALLHSRFVMDGSLTRDSFRTFMARWREALKTESGFQFQDVVYLTRTNSNPGVVPYPYWECELSEELPQQPSYPVPEGPFLDHTSGVFAPDVPTLATNWLAGGQWHQQSTLSHRYRLLIEDRRARIAGFEARDNELHVAVEATTADPLYCCGTVQSYTGLVQQQIQHVENGRATLRFDFSVQALDIWLTLDDGYPLDHYHESPHAAAWGRERSIYSRPPAPAALAATSLAEALEAGENQSAEFKPFIRLRPKDSKAVELLETVSAFANANGGALYLGVDDYGQPVGVDSDLRRGYGKEAGGDILRLQDAYVRDLKRLLNEGLTPAVLPEFRWQEVALGLVLQINVPKSTTPVSLITTGDLFRRVGATNRKLRPADVVQ